jgi:hypothetical protein
MRYCPYYVPGYENRQDFAEAMGAIIEEDPDCRFVVDRSYLACMFPEHALLPQAEVAELCYKRGLMTFDRLRNQMENGKVRYVAIDQGNLPTCPDLVGIPMSDFNKAGDFEGVTLFENPAADGAAEGRETAGSSSVSRDANPPSGVSPGP